MNLFKKSVIIPTLLVSGFFVFNTNITQAQVTERQLQALCKTVAPNTLNNTGSILTSAYNKLPNSISGNVAFSFMINNGIRTGKLHLPPGVTSMAYFSDKATEAIGEDVGTLLTSGLTSIVQSTSSEYEKKTLVDFAQTKASEILDDLAKKYNLTDTEKYALFWGLETGEIKFIISSAKYVQDWKHAGSFDYTIIKSDLSASHASNIMLCDPSFYPGDFNLFFSWLSQQIFDFPSVASATLLPNPSVSSISSVTDSSTPNTFKIAGSNFYSFNAVQLTPSSITEANTTLLATTHSFTGLVSSFFWNLIPYAHSQTVGSSANSIVIDNVLSDNTANSSVTFTVPAGTPNGVYGVSIGLLDGSWLSTGLKITLAASGSTVSGSSTTPTIPITGSGNGYYDGLIVSATPTYTCPLDVNNGTVKYTYVLNSSNQCIMYSSPVSSGGGMTTFTFGGSGPVGTRVNVPPIPATLKYVCPTVPTGISGGFSLSGTTCIFHTSTGVTIQQTGGGTVTAPPVTTTSTTTVVISPTTTTPPTTTTIPATAAYNCSTGTLSGTNCIITTTATNTYKCPSGSTLSGTSCSTPDTVGVTATSKYVNSSMSNKPSHYVYSCASGYTLKSSNNRCYKNTPTITNATQSYSCASGSTLSGSACTQSTPATPRYSCASGYTLNSTTHTCSKAVSMNNESSSTANVWDAIVNWFGGLFGK